MDVPLTRNWQNLHQVNEKKNPSQPDIRKSIDSSAKGVYLKMMKTAWKMALTLPMPHKHFSVLVKCQRINGVRLVAGKDNNKAYKWILRKDALIIKLYLIP